MKYLLILLTLLIFCPTVYAGGELSKQEKNEAEEIIRSGIDEKDTQKAEKIALVVKYIVYEASIGNQTAIKVATDFLSDYDKEISYLQRSEIKSAQNKLISFYIQKSSMEYKEQLFIQKAKDLLSETKYFKQYIKAAEPTADQVAMVWLKYIINNFDAFTYHDRQEPGIEKKVAEKMVEDNGLFAYLLNRMNLFSNNGTENKELREAYYGSLLALNEIILSDAKYQSAFKYKGFKVPDICKEISTFKEYEETTKNTDFRPALFKDAAENVIFKSVAF